MPESTSQSGYAALAELVNIRVFMSGYWRISMIKYAHVVWSKIYV